MGVLLPKMKHHLYQNGGPIIMVQVKNYININLPFASMKMCVRGGGSTCCYSDFPIWKPFDDLNHWYNLKSSLCWGDCSQTEVMSDTSLHLQEAKCCKLLWNPGYCITLCSTYQMVIHITGCAMPAKLLWLAFAIAPGEPVVLHIC